MQPSERFQLLIRQAVSTTGSYDPDECLYMIEEQLTFQEVEIAEAFLGWCHANGKQFGSATFNERFAEWRATAPSV